LAKVARRPNHSVISEMIASPLGPLINSSYGIWAQREQLVSGSGRMRAPMVRHAIKPERSGK
jgi:hypothetical protein